LDQINRQHFPLFVLNSFVRATLDAQGAESCDWQWWIFSVLDQQATFGRAGHTMELWKCRQQGEFSINADEEEKSKRTLSPRAKGLCECF
jgi:hypothetical protein